MTAPSDGVDERLALATTCYIERSKVRSILIESHIDNESTQAILQEVDALAVFTADDFRASARPAVDGGARDGLEPCPFCAKPPLVSRNKINPSARCVTEGCYGTRMSVVNLDDPEWVESWNTRLTTKPSDPDTMNTRRAEEDARLVERVRHECADIAAQYNDCSGDFIAEKIRDAATNLSSAGERKP